MKDRLKRLAQTIEREIGSAQQRVAKRRAEAALAASETRHRTLVDDHYDMVVSWRRDGSIVYANRAFAEQMDGSAVDFVGTDFLKTLGDAERSGLLDRLGELTEISPLFEEERSFACPTRDDRDTCHQRWNHRAIFDSEGRIEEYLSVGRDISDLRELEELDVRRRILTEAMRDTAAVLASTLDLDEALQRLLANLGAVIPNDSAVVLLDSDQGVKVASASGRLVSDEFANPVGSNLAPDEAAMLGLIAGGEKVAVIGDTSRDEDWPRKTPELAWVGSAMGAGLSEDGAVFGYLVLLSETCDRWTVDDLDSLEGFADYAAAAVRKAQLFEAETRQRKRLQRLSGQVEEAHELERKRISLELHDEVGQALTAVVMNLQWAAAQLGGDDTAHVAARLKDTASVASDVMQQIRSLSHRLRPSMLDDLGLESALRWFLDRFESWADVGCRFESAGFGSERLPNEIETVFFRIAQEALSNVATHARANSVLVRLEMTPKFASLLVEDDGVGFVVDEASASRTNKGIGLVNIRERLAAIGGRLRINSALQRGTQVLAEVPLEARE